MKKIFELFLGLLLISSIAIADNIPYVASKWEVVNNQIVTETFSDIHGTEVRVCALVCDPDDVANLNNAIVKARVFYPNGTSFILKELGQTTTEECIEENPNTEKCRIYTTTFTLYPENPIGYYTIIVFIEYSIDESSTTQSIIKGADRLVSHQNLDGGWGWPKGSPSCTNLAGVTSMGLYYAYKITEDEDYMQAMENSLQYIKTHSPTYDASCAETGPTCYLPGTDSNRGCDSNKDILFLAHLALLKNDDMIANLAKQRYEGKRNCFNPTDPIKGARAIANEIFNLRQSQGINAVALWDVGDWIVALYKLSEYPGIDYRLEADAMAELMKEKINGGYFDINDNTITYYYLGLVGIIEAMQTTGKYTDLVNLAKEKLINGQREEGWWPTDENESYSNIPDAQTTAYAKMVLEMLGEDEIAAKAATWLIVNQEDDGWWDADGEYDEVTSEGVWAIARDVSKQNRFKHLGADFKALREKIESVQNRISIIEAVIIEINNIINWLKEKLYLSDKQAWLWEIIQAMQEYTGFADFWTWFHTRDGCTEGALKCAGDYRYVCSNNKWVLLERCEYGCENGVCKPPTENCNAKDYYFCDGDNRMFRNYYCEEGYGSDENCALDKCNSIDEFIETCQYGCSNGICRLQLTLYECYLECKKGNYIEWCFTTYPWLSQQGFDRIYCPRAS